MTIVEPITVTDQMVVSSNVAETDDTAWSDVTTYAQGNTCMVTVRTKTATVASNYLASHRGNFILGNAFFEVNATDLSDFIGTDLGDTPYKLTLTDSTGKTAVGYIGAGGNGRVLGAELVNDGTFHYKNTAPETPWTWGAGWTVYMHAGKSVNGLLLSQDANLALNQLYYAQIKVSSFTSGKVALFYGSDANTFYDRISAATFTEYAMTDGAETFGATGYGASALSIDDLSVKAVTEPVVASSGGLHIVSSMNGTYRDWESVELGFNPMEIATYLIEKIGQGYHKRYESLVNGNIGNFPPTHLTGASPEWLELEATNRYKAFDTKTGSQTSNATTIEYSLTIGAFDSLAMFNLDATTVDLTLTDPIAGIVYDETITLNGATEFGRLDIPQYPNATLAVVISKTGTAKCGEIIPGLQTYIGKTMADPNPGLSTRDYSVKTVDEWGFYTFVERDYSNRIEFEISIPNTSWDDKFLKLASLRAVPLVWMHEDTAVLPPVYGFFNDLPLETVARTLGKMSIQVEGLT